MRVHLCGRHTRIQGCSHIGQMGRQKQVGVQRFEVAPWRLAPCEAAALDRQAVMLRRAEHPHARDRVVARQDDDFNPLCIGIVERQKLAHQRKRHARLGRLFQPPQLQLHISPVVALLEDLVFFFEVEQGTRRDRDDELAFQGCGHIQRMKFSCEETDDTPGCPSLPHTDTPAPAKTCQTPCRPWAVPGYPPKCGHSPRPGCGNGRG